MIYLWWGLSRSWEHKEIIQRMAQVTNHHHTHFSLPIVTFFLMRSSYDQLTEVKNTLVWFMMVLNSKQVSPGLILLHLGLAWRTVVKENHFSRQNIKQCTWWFTWIEEWLGMCCTDSWTLASDLDGQRLRISMIEISMTKTFGLEVGLTSLRGENHNIFVFHMNARWRVTSTEEDSNNPADSMAHFVGSSTSQPLYPRHPCDHPVDSWTK